MYPCYVLLVFYLIKLTRLNTSTRVNTTRLYEKSLHFKSMVMTQMKAYKQTYM